MATAHLLTPQSNSKCIKSHDLSQSCPQQEETVKSFHTLDTLPVFSVSCSGNCPHPSHDVQSTLALSIQLIETGMGCCNLCPALCVWPCFALYLANVSSMPQGVSGRYMSSHIIHAYIMDPSLTTLHHAHISGSLPSKLCSRSNKVVLDTACTASCFISMIGTRQNLSDV